MPSNSTTILTQQTYNTAGDAVQSYIGEKYQGDGYYGRSDGLHTIQVDLDGFIGTIQVQATLEIDPGDGDWFTVELGTGAKSVDTTGLIVDENITSIDYTSAATNSKIYNFTGNYVWVRAYVSNWTDGTVNYIKLNH